jgi:hypothetical protein
MVLIVANGAPGVTDVLDAAGRAPAAAVSPAGGSGDDRIEARNGASDSVAGGSGSDSAVVDLADVVTDVEAIDHPARARAKVARKVKVAVRGGSTVATFWVSCPAGAESSCTGVLRLSSAKTIRVAGIKVRLDLGSARFRVAPGQTAKVKVTLPAGAKRLAKSGKLAVRAIAASKEGGRVAESARSLTLALPRR